LIIPKIVKNVIKKSLFTPIATYGKNGVHISSCFNCTIIDDERIAIPYGELSTTRKNIRENGEIIIMVAQFPHPFEKLSSKDKSKIFYDLKAYRIKGRATILSKGKEFDKVKKEWSYARKAIILKVEKIESMI
tara:strand:+ start:2224 stop:2622 length:399 start_codon:yes stop_codon:yes gene_type:complete